jgi:hypothetical protein
LASAPLPFDLLARISSTRAPFGNGNRLYPTDEIDFVARERFAAHPSRDQRADHVLDANTFVLAPISSLSSRAITAAIVSPSSTTYWGG